MLLVFLAWEMRFRPVARGDEKRILVIVIGGLGDGLLFDPLFRRLKEEWPGARVDVLTGCFEEMWALVEPIDNLLFFTPSRFKPPWKYASFFRAIYRSKYDIVAEGIAMLPLRGIYPVFTSLVFEASRAPVRIGRKSTGTLPGLRPGVAGFVGVQDKATASGGTSGDLERPENPFLTHVIELLPPDTRDYHESAKIFEPLGLAYHRKKDEPRLGHNPSCDAWAEKLLRGHWAGEGDLIVGFTVETTRMIKSWPINNFLAILKWGIADGVKFVMLGHDANASGSAFSAFPRDSLFDLTGKTGLGEMISVIRQCDMFLSCDTGPSHIAQACHIPSVVLFGPSNEVEFGPADLDLHALILPSDDDECRPCVLGPCIVGKSCIQRIQPETVYAAMRQRLGDVHIPRRGAGVHKPARVLCSI
jgi:ADP-heptose:LPS heptosyltransferase